MFSNNALKFAALSFLFSAFAFRADAEIKVKNVVCKPQDPSGEKVDISYEVSSDDPAGEILVYPTGYDKSADLSVPISSTTGDAIEKPIKPGKHHFVWNCAKDYPGFDPKNFDLKISALKKKELFLVVDLSGGKDAEKYPVSYLDRVPEGGWSDEYKTKKLVLRLVPSGTFMMGSPKEEFGRFDDESARQRTLNRPFYIGVFEVTQKQYELVMGDSPSYYKGDERPVELNSYNDVRGATESADSAVNADSFIGRLRKKTGMRFDLPAEDQWEYACRAGTSTALNSGKNLNGTDNCGNANEVGRYHGNQNDGKGGYDTAYTKVGAYKPNAWGLYDMHGNVMELCLNGHGPAPKGEDKAIGSGGSHRVLRGGSWRHAARRCRSAYRNYYHPVDSSNNFGFRVSLMP